ncbi:MAG: ribonuclease III [Firmicutes bacterium]|nr:ribonuclease III [Bacillota bacterium]
MELVRMEFLKRFKIEIKNKKLLQRALTHSSYANEHKEQGDYERLEFLGDAVLQMIVSKYLYLKTEYDEGKMTKMRSSYVCEEALSTYAREIKLDKYVYLGVGQLDNLNNTILADVFEAVVAVIYLDQGLKKASDFVITIIKPYINKNIIFNNDYKTLLQEYVQMDKKTLVYEIVNEYGKSNDKTFEVVVKIDEIIYGKGIGKSKKEAEQKAAFDAYQKSANLR